MDKKKRKPTTELRRVECMEHPFDPEVVWTTISKEEKRQLITFFLTSPTKPWTTKSIAQFTHFPAEVVHHIGSFFSRDPEGFFNLSGTCKFVHSAIGDYGNCVDKHFIAPFVHRLINRANKVGLGLRIKFHKIFDEKCRYIDIDHEKIRCSAKICKNTGLILSPQGDMPRGYITDPQPEKYFGPHGLLVYVKDLEKQDPTYRKRRKIMIDEHKKLTAQLKATGSLDKKRKYSATWDESQSRKKHL